MIQETKDGVRFDVRVTPRAGRDEIVGWERGILKVRLKAPPVEGAANEALIAFLAGVLNQPKRQITLVSGQTGRQKVVAVAGLSREALLRRLPENLGG